jgi:hypothetical protein
MKAATPTDLQYYIEDSFKKITFYSTRGRMNYKKLTNGTYQITLDVESTENYFDGNGKLLSTGTKPNFKNLLCLIMI